MQIEPTSSVHPIQLDAAFSYQQAAINVVGDSLRQTHGAAFTEHFIREFREAILNAAKTRICGRDEAWLRGGSQRLKGECSSLFNCTEL